MKIAIIGTHSTGKTTLIKRLVERLTELGHRVVILPEFARLCPFPINEDTTLAAQAWIQETQIREEGAVNHTDRILICDRSTLDNFAYFSRIAEKLENAEYLKPWEKKAAAHMRTYDAVFKTAKLDLLPEDDKQRSLDADFRNDIDERIHSLLAKHGVTWSPLPATEDYDRHIEFILKEIKSKPTENA